MIVDRAFAAFVLAVVMGWVAGVDPIDIDGILGHVAYVTLGVVTGFAFMQLWRGTGPRCTCSWSGGPSVEQFWRRSSSPDCEIHGALYRMKEADRG